MNEIVCGYYVVILRATIVHICPIYSTSLRSRDERTVVAGGSAFFCYEKEEIRCYIAF